MSSGLGEAEWRLEFEPRNAPFLDPLMGWTGGRDPLRQVSLSFPALEAALAYAERQGLRTIVHHDAQSRADQRNVARRAFSDGTLVQLGLGRLQKSYGEAMAQASRGEGKAQRESGDSPMDVVLRSDLSVDEKRSILMDWAFDLHLILQRQLDAAAASRLSEIEEAMLVLEDRAGRRPSVPAPHISTHESLAVALKHFYRAIELDNVYAEPHAWASIVYSRRKQAQWMADPRAECEEGARLGRRTIELRPDNPVALGASGFALTWLAGETAAGIQFIDRALALNPNDAQTWHGSGWARCYNGDHDLAIEHIGQAQRLSPIDPQVWQFQLAACLAHFLAGRYDAAIDLARTVIHGHPGQPAGYIHLARSAALAGRPDEAHQAMARALELNPNLKVSTNSAFSILRRPEDKARVVEGFRLAGMPE